MSKTSKQVMLLLMVGLFLVTSGQTCDPITRTLTIEVEGEGSAIPSVGAHNYPDGTVVYISAAPATGWEFYVWDGEVADPGRSTTTVLMDKDKTVTAVFRQVKCRLTIEVEGEGSVQQDPSDWMHDIGAVVKVTAFPREGWRFKEWRGEVDDPDSSETTVLMDKDKTVTAVFERDEDPPPADTKPVTGLEIGDRVVDTTWEWEYRTGSNYSGTGKIKPVTWIVVAKDHYGENSGVTLLTEDLIAKFTFDDSTNIHSGGSNHWGNSGTDSTATNGLRPWLNSTGMYVDEGFYKEFSEELKALTKYYELPNSDWESGDTYTTSDKVFIPSTTELGGTDYSETYPIGTWWEYFTQDSDLSATLCGSSSIYWTRSPNSIRPDTVFIITPYGTFARYQASWGDAGVRAAINIRNTARVYETPLPTGEYELWVPVRPSF